MEENRIYKTLEELVYYAFDGEETIMQDLDLGVAGDDGNTPKTTYFKSIINWYFEITSPDASWNGNEYNTLFCTYIYPRYRNMAIAYGETQQECDKNAYTWLTYLLNRMKTTKDEYVKLINLFDDIKNNLLDEIKTQTKYNDTPQSNTTAGVTSYDDTYNSNVSTTYNDGASKIARLAEVEAYIKDYYEKWCNTVTMNGGIFIYE